MCSECIAFRIYYKTTKTKKIQHISDAHRHLFKLYIAFTTTNVHQKLLILHDEKDKPLLFLKWITPEEKAHFQQHYKLFVELL